MKMLENEKPRSWEIEKKCTGYGFKEKGCGARLLISESDIITEISGFQDIYFSFKCPCCGSFTDIPESDIDSRVRKKLVAKYGI